MSVVYNDSTTSVCVGGVEGCWVHMCACNCVSVCAFKCATVQKHTLSTEISSVDYHYKCCNSKNTSDTHTFLPHI